MRIANSASDNITKSTENIRPNLAYYRAVTLHDMHSKYMC